MMGNIYFILAILSFSIAKEVCGGSDIKDIKGRLLTPAEGCGLTKVRNTRIVGGSDAPVGAWPWIVALGYVRQGNLTVFDCGGSLITSRHVLSATHCIDNELKFARLGERDLRTEDDGPHQDIPIARSVAHEQYDPVWKFNDIAMLHLERDVEFSDRIRPICLPLDEPLRNREFAGDNPFVAGWGSMYATGWKARVLQQVQVPVVDMKTCRDLHTKDGVFNVNVMINVHVICAGGLRGKGCWKGDSGGPLMLPIHQNGSFPFYQIGIVNFGYGCTRENVPSIYAKVQYHADWIKKQLENSAVNASKTIE